MSEPSDTRERILDAAQALVQTRGYDGFSYADIADRVGIRKASIHHHFPTKGDLARLLVERFREACRARLAELDRLPDARRKLDGYVGLFRESLEEGRMCLCGMLAAGHATLPDAVREAVLATLAEHETWLARVLRDGRESGHFRFHQGPRDQARALLASLEGALMLARLHGDRDRFRASVSLLLDRQEPSAVTS